MKLFPKLRRRPVRDRGEDPLPTFFLWYTGLASITVLGLVFLRRGTLAWRLSLLPGLAALVLRWLASRAMEKPERHSRLMMRRWSRKRRVEPDDPIDPRA